MQYGSLCSGIGGLDRAIERVLKVTPAWFCEADQHAASVLRRWWPDVPVLPDLKTQDWTQVEPVDLVSAGYPCQPFSAAGQRRGVDDPRHLWPFVIAAVRVLRPRLVVLENVSGHLGLGFDAVLCDLAEAGFDAEWAVVPASASGACHRRERLFVVAHARGERLGQHPGEPPTQEAGPHEDHQSDGDGSRWATAHADKSRLERAQPTGRRLVPAGSDGAVAPDALDDEQGPVDSLSDGADQLDGVESAAASRRRDCATPDTDSTAGRPERKGCRPGEVQGAEVDERSPVESGRCHSGDRPAGAVAWGDFGPAIERWGHVIGRQPPEPTDEKGRLNVPFVEWMMGFDAGWVDGLSRTAALRCLGNAVVQQQGELALRMLLEAA